MIETTGSKLDLEAIDQVRSRHVAALNAGDVVQPDPGDTGFIARIFPNTDLAAAVDSEILHHLLAYRMAPSASGIPTLRYGSLVPGF